MSYLCNTSKIITSFGSLLSKSIVIPNRHYARVKQIYFYLLKSDGTRYKLKGYVNSSLLDTIHDNLDMPEYGICNGSPECSTCHVIFHPEDYDKISDEPSQDELDVLDKALESTKTSRLGCQITIEAFMDGIEIMLPSATKNNSAPDDKITAERPKDKKQ